MNNFQILPSGYGIDHWNSLKKFSNDIEKVIVLWPSTGGNARAFRISELDLRSQRTLLLRYNPSSHGGNLGTYHPSNARDDLLLWLKEYKLSDKKLIGIGHSGGASCLLMLWQELPWDSFFLLSPILDSRLSLFHLYQNQHIHEFLQLLVNDSKSGLPEAEILEKRERVYSALSDPRWLETSRVGDLAFSVSNKNIHLESLSEFLTNLFLPGFQIYEALDQCKVPIQIFLPSKDNWFPKEITQKYEYLPQITIREIEKAPDHFFTHSWLEVWKQIREEIFLAS